MSPEFPLLFYFAIPVVAMLYASVGHGGASGYLALMALAGTSTLVMKPTALILNLFVAGISFIFYYKKGFFRWKLFFPFAITSIPAAFIGGYIEVEPGIYKKILAVFLMFSVLRLSGILKFTSNSTKDLVLWQSLIFGLIIGLFSGLIGIGGGIILSPLILLLHWADMKQTAAVSALFIWINSLSGLAGMMLGGLVLNMNIAFITALAVVGGIIGAMLGSNKINNLVLKRVLALVLCIAGIKLFFI